MSVYRTSVQGSRIDAIASKSRLDALDPEVAARINRVGDLAVASMTEDLRANESADDHAARMKVRTAKRERVVNGEIDRELAKAGGK